MDAETINKKRQSCWDRAIYAHGTAWVLEKRAEKHRRNLRAVSFLGILVPLSVGGAALAFGTNSDTLGAVLIISGVLSIFQIITSAWSLVAKWDDALSQSVYSLERNTDLKLSWKKLAEGTDEQLTREYEFLLQEDHFQEKHDIKLGFSEKEKRQMMRAGLHEFQRPCAACKEVPKSLKATKCTMCGKF